MIWLVIVALALGTLVLKSLGPLLAGGAEPPSGLNRVIDLLTPALLTSLVVTSTMTSGQDVVLDARLAGVAVGLALLLARGPLVVALLAAAVVVAGVRAFG